MLQLCVSQQINKNPFSFKATGIRVYSFEEAIYHVYHYWRESVDDLLSDGMIAWVGEIGHSYLASRMKEMAKEEQFTKRILDFLGLTPYFSKVELDTLKSTLKAWESRREWEKLKERADYLASRGEPGKALALYKRALQFNENAQILNNMGVVYMQLSQPKDALRQLTRALTLEPKNMDILLHYIEAAILSGNFDNAAGALVKAEARDPNCADIPFLRGLMSCARKNFQEALEYFGKAIAQDPTVPYYVYKMADVHMEMRQFDKALECLKAFQASEKDATYYAKEAELYASAGDIPAAIKSMEQAADLSDADSISSASIWAGLGGYHRQNYEPKKGEDAIKKALAIAPDNNLVQLENARIKKGLGRSKEYQAALSDIINRFKEKYREEI